MPDEFTYFSQLGYDVNDLPAAKKKFIERGGPEAFDDYGVAMLAKDPSSYMGKAMLEVANGIGVASIAYDTDSVPYFEPYAGTAYVLLDEDGVPYVTI